MEDVLNLTEEQSFEVLSDGGSMLEGKRVLNHSNTFGVFNAHGDIINHSPQGLQGIYHKGTRFVSHLELRLNGIQPILLGSTIKEQNEMLSVDLTNPKYKSPEGKVMPQGQIHIMRNKFIRDGGCYEEIDIANYHSEGCRLEIAIGLQSDFKDIFQLRGTERPKMGNFVSNGSEPGKYVGLDGIDRWIEIETFPKLSESNHQQLKYTLDLAAGEQFRFHYALKFHVEHDSSPNSYEGAKLKLKDDMSYHKELMAGVRTGNEQFTHWINRSRTDLISLLAQTDRGFSYPYAGVPWYNTAFGRDGILTAFQTLWLAPNISRNVLLFLAQNQATEENPAKDAEPGKIVHEMRDGEMANTGEIPFDKYYGTIDATPLFIMLAGDYYLRTGDLKTIEKIWPNIENAMHWIDNYGDIDKDGFVEYIHKSHNGLANQGWKDSNDSVNDEHGRLAEPPIALCEVQAYVYGAKRKAAKMAKALGLEVYKVWKESAARLKQNFNEKFWDEDLQCYVLALDGKKNPCRVKSSNAGQCLLTGIVDASKAGKLARTLLSKEMFSGWGIRTLAEDAPRYNPMSYHNGSVWPHDVALIAEGLSRYGFKDEVHQLMTGLFDASLFIEYQRLPELFCGFPRRGGEGPTDYPVACSPQAWSVASVFMLLKACLCIDVDATKKVIYFNDPKLPPYLDFIQIKDLSIGKKGDICIEIYRHSNDVGIIVKGKPDDWEVRIKK